MVALAILQIEPRLHATTASGGSEPGGTNGTSLPPPGVPLVTPTAADLDGDGIPNTWETANSHNPNDATDAARDFDNDGLTTLQEYQLSVSSNGLHGNPIGKWKAFTQPVPQSYADQGLQSVWPNCANDRGDIVVQMEGEFYDENNDWHWQSACALIKADGTWTPINIPGKSDGYLYASGINDNGLILVQWYSEDWSLTESYYYSQNGTASIIKIGGRTVRHGPCLAGFSAG